MKKKALIPLALFLVLAVFLAIGLTRDPRVVPSPLIGKDAPQFTAPVLASPEKTFALQDMRGKVWLLNVWASWCTACLQEHPVLVDYARRKDIPLVGLAYKDKPADSIKWLQRKGDPYDFTVVDQDGRIGIDFGVYGVPETFLIDQAGKIRFKQIGTVTVEALEKQILPLIRELQRLDSGSPCCWRCNAPLPALPRRPTKPSPWPKTRWWKSAWSSSPRSCAAWCARTNRWPARAPTWRWT